MVAFLKNVKKIHSVNFHQEAKNLVSLIESLNLTIKPKSIPISLLNLIETTIVIEGVFDVETSELQVFSPLFDLQLTSKTLEQMLNKNTIIHKKDHVDNKVVESIVWGQFFKHISTSIRFVDDIALIQPKLKKILPTKICEDLFGKKHLTQHDFSTLIGVDRSLIAHAISNIRPQIIKPIESSSTFLPAINLNEGRYE